MPRLIQELLDHAQEPAKRFEDYEPAEGDERSVEEYLLERAALARARSEQQLADAVVAARAAGVSWQRIGGILGTSAQAAEQRYAALVEPTCPDGAERRRSHHRTDHHPTWPVSTTVEPSTSPAIGGGWTSLGSTVPLDKGLISSYKCPVRRRPGVLLPLEIDILRLAAAALTAGDGWVHGFGLAKALRDDRGATRLTAHGTLYKALGRLADAGLVADRWEDPERALAEGRPRRRLYRITADGQRALAGADAPAAVSGPTTRVAPA